MKDSDVKNESGEGWSGTHHGFRKKGGKFRKLQSTANEFFRGV